jgi:L-aspartate oxidase
MSAKCGVVRDAAGLGELLETIEILRETHGPARPLVTAGLMAEAALARKESRGGHFRSDFPETDAPERQFLLREFPVTAEEVAHA